MPNRFLSLSALFLLLLALNVSSCASKIKSNGGNTSQAGVVPQDQSKHETAKSLLPRPTGFVNDYQNVFSVEDKQRLESLLTELKNKADIEFDVVTIETTGSQPIFDYSLALAREWGVGSRDNYKGGGLLLLLAIKDRKWRLQVSRGLETDLPDNVCKQLGDESEPLYRQGNYAAGITKYAKALISRLENKRGFQLNVEPT